MSKKAKLVDIVIVGDGWNKYLYRVPVVDVGSKNSGMFVHLDEQRDGSLKLIHTASPVIQLLEQGELRINFNRCNAEFTILYPQQAPEIIIPIMAATKLNLGKPLFHIDTLPTPESGYRLSYSSALLDTTEGIQYIELTEV